MKRPSYRELAGKLREAKGAALNGCLQFVEPAPIYADLLEIDVVIDDLAEIVPQALEEIKPADYAGTRPPQQSYEAAILKCELFAFVWSSGTFGCTMYLKFAVKERCLWIVSLHKDRK